MEINYLIAFSLGLFSTVHCLGMCGGIITALSLGLPDEIKQNRTRFAILVCAYNLGRVCSYTVAGALAGIFGHTILGLMHNNTGHYLLRILAGLILILLGLHIGGWITAIKRIEGAGMRLWQVIRPIGAYFLPVDSMPKALLMGCIWGWLPCGMVYSVLLWSATSADPLGATLCMLGFGLGTLPGMISAGLLSNSLQRLFARADIKKAFAIIIICFGIASPWIQFSHDMHDGSTGMQHMH